MGPLFDPTDITCVQGLPCRSVRRILEAQIDTLEIRLDHQETEMKAEMQELKAIPNKQPEMRASIGCPVGSVSRTG